MTDIAWRNLVREKGRLAISVGGVAFAVLLILLVRGLYVGFSVQATEYLRSVEADVWVGQAGTRGGFFHSVSILPRRLQADLSRVEGVRRVAPLLGRPVVGSVRGSEGDLYLLGVDPRTGIGGPPGIERGRRVSGPGEIVVDRVFAHKEGVGVGDAVDVASHRLRVVGVARGGNSIIAQYAWASLPDVSRLVGAEGVASYFLVRGERGIDASILARRIRAQVPGTNPVSEQVFTDQSTADIREGFLPIVWVLVIIAFVIGTAVIGLTIYTATLEKRHEYGVLKAIGFSNRQLLRIVWRQSLTAGAIGLVAGVMLALVVGRLLERLLPSFVTSFIFADLLLVAVASAGMSLAASFVPFRPLTRLDPAQVFRV